MYLALDSWIRQAGACPLQPTCSQLIKEEVKTRGINGFPEALHLGDCRVHAQFNKVILSYSIFNHVYILLVSQGEKVSSTVTP